MKTLSKNLAAKLLFFTEKYILLQIEIH